MRWGSHSWPPAGSGGGAVTVPCRLRPKRSTSKPGAAVIRGVFETHLDVIDLDRSVEFYGEVLELELALRRDVDAARADAHSRGARRFAFFWVGGQGHAMLGLWERDRRRIRTQHFAFEVVLQELTALVAR